MAYPKKYKRVFCKRIIEMGEIGKLPISWCRELKVSKTAMQKWCDEYPEFEEAYDLAKSLAEGYFAEQAISSDTATELGRNKFALSAYFRVSEVNKVEATQDIKASVNNELEISFSDRPEDEIDEDED